MTTFLVCLSCFSAGFIIGRLKTHEPVRRIKIRTLEPRWDFTPAKPERN